MKTTWNLNPSFFKINSLSLRNRLTALLLLVALLIPLMLLNPGRTVSAQEKRVSSAIKASINAAPPKPFVIGAGNSPISDHVTGFLTSSALSINNYFFPQLPKEFGNARWPSIGEKMFFSAGSFFGLFVPANPAPAAALTQPVANVDFDFDGDGMTDISRWQSSSTEWRVKNSSGGITNTNIGSPGNIIAPGDFDGDGLTDMAVFAAGTWTIKYSQSGTTATFTWGVAGDKPVTADYNSDGKDDLAVFRPSTGTWWIYYSGTGTPRTIAHGSSGDIPVQGDFDGDGQADLAVYRPSNGNWYITGMSTGSSTFTWGNSGDTPVPADYDGDGKTDYAVYRPSTGAWWIYKSSTGTAIAPNWGNFEDQPVPGDYDGDSKADLAVWRPANAVWYIIKSSTGGYQYETMGQAGDTAIPSAYVKQSGSTAFTYELAKARSLPKNATGGTNLFSRNFSWEAELVNLPGRNGLDLSLGISYNSLVWTKQGGNVYFDTDHGNVSPGFRLDFPTIDPIYYDSGTSKYNYLMVTPSGTRMEFRQTAVTNTYETTDSSYLQLTVTGAKNPNDAVEDLTLRVFGTDGSQMSFEWKGGAYRCKEIKDRNGNFISIYHNDEGLLSTITDTLGAGREISINYDNELYPTSITQTWKAGNGEASNTTHTYATFTYSTKTVNTDFDGLTIAGPPNGTVVKVLDKLTYASGFFTKFDYNGYLQVWKISNYAADSSSHVLNYVSTDLNDSSLASDQTDCPRFTVMNSWVENFNLVSGVAQAVVTHNTAPISSSYSVGDQSGDAYKVQSWIEGHPDNLRTNLYFGSSRWRNGLPVATEDCLTTNPNECTNPKRWTWKKWTQDDESLSYSLNPRVVETKVGDGVNTKRTTISHYIQPPLEEGPETSNVSVYGLVSEIKQYEADQATVLKRTAVEYNLDSVYTDRRVIGLPSLVQLYDGSDTLISKFTYEYDQGNLSDSSLGQDISPVQHDDIEFSSGFVAGRGNLTGASLWNIDNNEAITTGTKYNTAGSPVLQTDAMGRSIKVGYADLFNDGNNSRGTFAYPTRLTEIANSDSSHNFSTIQYRFDIGENVSATSPIAENNSYGKTTKQIFDSYGRLEKRSVFAGSTERAYVRYNYQSDGIHNKIYSTGVNLDGDTDLAEDEVLSENWTDGAGRVLRSRLPHAGSTYSATLIEYDKLGQVSRKSVPTEVTSSWVPTGDDYRGVDANNIPIWLWNSQEHDWRGRVTRQVNTDGTDRLIEYGGCGCAGGQVATIRGEEVQVPDQEYSARRKQKIYADISGRTVKTELYGWPDEGLDNGTVYSTIENTFNGRDQITLSRTYAGGTGSSTFQDTTMSYDGLGRLHSSHQPEQRSGSNVPTSTTYAYADDGQLTSVADGRGAITNYNYNDRGFLRKVSYSVPSGSGITVPSDVEFSYDNLGNRLLMTDEYGSVVSHYNELSQLTSEKREFSETLSDAPASNNGFLLTYEYYTTGQLKSYTDPYGEEIEYSLDGLGRISTVTGSSFAGVTDYADNSQYRAWGGLKHLEYGNGMEMDMTYDNRLQPLNFLVTDPADSTRKIFDRNYEYFADGKLKVVDDNYPTSGGSPNAPAFLNRFDRTFDYDHLGRVLHADAGLQTTGGTPPSSLYVPYSQDYTYNALGNLLAREADHWNFIGHHMDFGNSFANNRITDAGNTYDEQGHQTAGDDIYYAYDARGSMSKTWRAAAYETLLSRDGKGNDIKRSQREWNSSTNVWENWETRYFIYSSVLNKIASEAGQSGKKKITYVVAGEEIARQEVNNTVEYVAWTHRDPSGLSSRSIAKAGEIPGPDSRANEELDGLGNNIGIFGNLLPNGLPKNGLSGGNHSPFGDRDQGGCEQGGIYMGCSMTSVEASFLLYREGDNLLAFTPNTDLPTRGGNSDPFSAFALSRSAGLRVMRVADRGGNLALRNGLHEIGNLFFSLLPGDPNQEIDDAIDEAESMLTEDCRAAIDQLLRDAAKAKGGAAYAGLTGDDKTETDATLDKTFNATNLISKVRGATRNLEHIHELNIRDNVHDKVTTDKAGSTVTLTFYAGFFGVVNSGKKDIVINNQTSKPYIQDKTSLKQKAMSILHEGIHASGDGYTDGFIGRIIKGKTKDLEKDEGSEAINAFLRDHCEK